jgi:hypothetical protein
MIVKTKKYKIPTNTFIKLGLKGILKEQWWVWLIFIALCSMTFVIPSNWWWIGALIALVIYWLFWLIQFAGVTQLDQAKMLFEKLSYQISSKEIIIWVNTKQGMPVTWDKVKKASIEKDAFLLSLSKVQLIYLPFKIFNTENDKRFVESILKRKGLVK